MQIVGFPMGQLKYFVLLFQSECNGVSNGTISTGHVISAGDDGGGGPPDKKND